MLQDDTPDRSPSPWRSVAARILIASAALLCGAALGANGQHYVNGADPQFPRVKMPDSLVTLNDRCIVRKSKLATTIRPVYVNLHPVGFC